jgi:hypothetical protein
MKRKEVRGSAFEIRIAGEERRIPNVFDALVRSSPTRMHFEMRILSKLFNADQLPSGADLFQLFPLFRATIRPSCPYGPKE